MRLTSQNRGFSLVELLVASTAMLLLVGGLANVFMTQNRAYKTQTDLVETRTDSRLAMELLVRQVRDAGYHTPATILPVCEADAQRIKVHGDWNDDGYVDQLVYEYDSVKRQLVRRYLIGTGANLVDCSVQDKTQELVADRVLNLAFAYYDEAAVAVDQTPTPLAMPVAAADLTSITRVSVELTLFTREDPQLRGGSHLGFDVFPAMPGRARLRTLLSRITLRNVVFRLG